MSEASLREKILEDIRTEHYGHALELLDAALEEAPDALELRYQRGLLRAFHNLPEAEEDLAVACGEPGSERWSVCQHERAGLALRLSDFPRARALLLEIVAVAPEPAALERLAELHLELEEWEEARGYHARTHAARGFADTNHWVREALLAERDGKLRAFALAVARVTEAWPEARPWDLARRGQAAEPAQLERWLEGLREPAEAEEWLLAGLIHEEQGALDDAVGAFQAALLVDPRLAQADHGIARCALRGEDPPRALHHLRHAVGTYRRALRSAPDSLLADLADAAERGGAGEEALAAYRELASRANPQPEIYEAIAQILEGDGRLSEAANAFSDAAALAPNDPSYLLRAGNLLLKSGRPGSALSAFQRTLELGPNAAAHLGKARCEEELERHDAALVSYRAALELAGEAPMRLEALRGQGRVLLAMEEYGKEAKVAVAKLLEDSPDDRDGLVLLGDLKRAEGDFDEAARAYSRALDKSLRDSLLCEGVRLAGERRYTQALKCFTEAQRCFPPDGELFYAIASVYGQMNTPNKAASYLEMALELWPEAGRMAEKDAAFELVRNAPEMRRLLSVGHAEED